MKKPLIRISIGVFALVALASVASIFFLGSIVKNRVETVGPRVAQVEVKLDSADVWLLPGRAQLKGLSIGNPPGCKTETAVKVGDISIRMNTMSALSDKAIIDSIIVKSPEITIEGGLKNNNLTQIQKNVNAYVSSHADSSPTGTGPAASPSAAGKPGRKLQINDLLITAVRLRIISLFSSGASVTISLPDIHLANLGAGPAGITSSEVAQKALAALLNSIAANAADAIGKLGKGAVSTVKKSGEKFKGLFDK
jgi:uncharacterized protein involved in outer membrane biogenesis